MSVRLQKFLADAGVASRRASEQIILEGRVDVNGRTVRELGAKIDPLHDRVRVDGRPLKAKKKLYLAVHKPPGYICSRTDPEQRRCVGDLLPAEWNNLYSVGRLDFKSEGLIFFTNDGDFSLKLTHPRFGVEKKYIVTAKGHVGPEILRQFTKGVFFEEEVYKAVKARALKAGQSHSIVEMVLREGKNREIRRMFEAVGIEIERLQRVQIGPVKLGELPKGKWRTLTEREIKSLLSTGNQNE